MAARRLTPGRKIARNDIRDAARSRNRHCEAVPDVPPAAKVRGRSNLGDGVEGYSRCFPPPGLLRRPPRHDPPHRFSQ